MIEIETEIGIEIETEIVTEIETVIVQIKAEAMEETVVYPCL